MADIPYSWEQKKYSNDSFSQKDEGYSNSSSKNRLRNILIKLCISFVVVALFAEVVFYALILPATSSAVINVYGTENLTTHEVLAIANLKGNVKWFSVDSFEVSKRLVSFPLVASVTVEKKFPDIVIIKITERKPVAISFAEIDGKTVPMEIDKYGVVFRIGSYYVPKNLPIITGLIFNNPVEGMHINKKLAGLFRDLDILKKTTPVLLNEISEIKISPIKYGGYDLIIYPVKCNFSIVTNKQLTADSLKYIMLISDVIRDTGLDKKIEEVDVRGSSAVYKTRGGKNE